MTLRSSAYNILDPSSRCSKKRKWSLRLSSALQILIILNVFAAIFHTVEDIRDDINHYLNYFEYFSITIFTVEYFARLWVCVENQKYKKPIWGRIRYSLTPLAIVDLIAIIPFYFAALGVDARHLRILRLLKLFRHSKSLKLFVKVYYSQRERLTTALFFFLVTWVFISSIVYWLEKDVQPEQFSSIPAAMWWGMTTLTTIGYGDIVPITSEGRIVGSICAILGVTVYAVITGIIVAGFTHEVIIHDEKKLIKTEQKKLLATIEQKEQKLKKDISRNYVHKKKKTISKSKVAKLKDKKTDT